MRCRLDLAVIVPFSDIVKAAAKIQKRAIFQLGLNSANRENAAIGRQPQNVMFGCVRTRCGNTSGKENLSTKASERIPGMIHENGCGLVGENTKPHPQYRYKKAGSSPKMAQVGNRKPGYDPIQLICIIMPLSQI